MDHYHSGKVLALLKFNWVEGLSGLMAWKSSVPAIRNMTVLMVWRSFQTLVTMFKPTPAYPIEIEGRLRFIKLHERTVRESVARR